MRAVDAGLLALAVNRWSPEHARAARALEEIANGDEPWALPWSAATEFLARVTHRHAVARPLRPEEACGFLELLLSSPTVRPLAPTPRHAAVLREVAAMLPEGTGLPAGIETAALLREHGVRELLSFDPDMRRYPFLTVVNPLRRDLEPGPRRRYRMLRSPGAAVSAPPTRRAARARARG